MSNWIALTAWEIAFLAQAGSDEDTVLDHVSASGDWLRASGIQAKGRELLERRIEASADVPPETWLYLAAAARVLVDGVRSIGVLAEGDSGTNALVVADDAAGLRTYLLASAAGYGLHTAPASDGLSDVLNEVVATVGVPRALTAVGWTRGSEHLSRATWTLDDEVAFADAVEALNALMPEVERV